MKKSLIYVIFLMIIPGLFANGNIISPYERDGQRPLNLDTAVVLDRSYSMAGAKINQAATAIGNFLNLLEIDDELGIASYNHEAETNFSMTIITSSAVVQSAANALNGLEVISLTSIGAGMIEGQSILADANISNPPKGMLLLSDGNENFSPMVQSAYGAIPEDTDIYTIAFGGDADQNLMNEIATNTNGLYYYGTGGDLSDICEEIMTQMRGRGLVFKEAGTITAGDDLMISYPVTVDKAEQVVFTLMWDHKESALDFDLFDPDGYIITSDALVERSVEIFDGKAIKFYRIQNPKAGTWYAKFSSAYIASDFDSESYYFHVSTKADLRLFTELNQNDYQIGESIGMKAQLLNGNMPQTGAVVTADIYNFDVFIESITLYDDGQHNDDLPGDGIYGNFSSPYMESQTCTIIFNAKNSDNDSFSFNRVKTHSTYVHGNQQNQLPVIREFYVANNDRGEDVITPPLFNINNAPNPFNPDTYINFNMAIEGHLNVSIYNVRGQKVKTLIDEYYEPAAVSKRWDGTNADGEVVSSGIYYYTIKIGEYQETRKMVLMK